MLPRESVDFIMDNKLLIVKYVDLCHECWKKRCGLSHETRVQTIELKNEIESTNEKYLHEIFKELKNYVDAYEIDENSSGVNDILL